LIARKVVGAATDLWYFFSMGDELPTNVTRLLDAFRAGEAGADRRLFEATYEELRRLAGCLMACEEPGHTLQTTALVHEAYLKLVGGGPVYWANRRHFLNTVARAMRQVLVDRARRVARPKHGGDRARLALSSIDTCSPVSFPAEQAAELEEAVMKLMESYPRCGEVVHFRFFAGLTIEQTAEVMEISPALVKKDWRFARAWLLRALEDDGEAGRRGAER
jgi:RNA polymerase sigma factor (TIGR02999 family)